MLNALAIFIVARQAIRLYRVLTRRRTHVTLAAFAVLALAAQARAQAVATVRVAASPVAQGERLTLGDIAEVSASNVDMAVRVRAVALGYAPNVGAVRELTREKIALALAAAGFSAGAVRLDMPTVVTVRRAGQAVKDEVLRAAVERVALAELLAGGATARLVRLDLPPSTEVPSGRVEARAALGGVKNLFAPFPVTVELLVEGRTVRRLSTTAQVEAFAPVVVAARDLAERVQLREADVRTEVRRLERPFNLYARDFARLRGAALSRAVANGDPVTTDALYAEIVVRPGDVVRVVGESGSLSLSVAGEARAAGRVGDRIQVKNTQSGALLQAVVVDEGLVRVRF